MSEILYTGSVSGDDMPQIIVACRFEPKARFLAEQLPEHYITDIARARQELLCFAYVENGTPFAAYATGRIFQEDRELRWEKHAGLFHIVYIGPSESTIEDLFHRYKLNSRTDQLQELAGDPEPETTYYALFGERLKAEDLRHFGKTAQQGDFAVVRIPRVLRYPVELDDRPAVRLLVREYHDPKTGSVALFRFQKLETWNDKEKGEASA